MPGSTFMKPISELDAKLQTGKILLGVGIETASASSAEMAGMLGFDLVWIDVEHGSPSAQQVETCCIGAKAGGAWPMVRIPSADRTHVLRALEAGARLVVVPMVESAEVSRKVVEYGKYRPYGNRGFAGSTRGLLYGISNALANTDWANRETHLFVQIETVDGLRNCAEIVAVEGISGGVLGPADLSFSMNKPLQFENPEIVSAVNDAIRQIRAQDKIAILVTANPVLIQAGIEAGVQVIVCASERASLRAHWQQTIQEVSSLIARRGSETAKGLREKAE